MTTTEQIIQKSQHHTFIHEMATHGQQRRAYMAAYTGCSPETADRGAYRLLEKPEIRYAIDNSRAKLLHMQQEVMDIQLERRLRKLEDKEEVVWQIFKGELQKTVYGKDGNVTRLAEDPDLRLRAMKQDTLLGKERAALMQEMTTTPGVTEAMYRLLRGGSTDTEGTYGLPMLNDLPDFFSEEEIYGDEDHLHQTEEPCMQEEKTVQSYESVDPSEAGFEKNAESQTEKNQKNTAETGSNRTFPDQESAKQPEHTYNNTGAAVKDKGWKNTGIYASLPKEERDELDELRQRYMAAKAATDKVLYGSIETEKAA